MKLKLVLWASVVSLISLGLIASCSSLKWQALSTRVTENLEGQLTKPGNIDPPGNNNFEFVVVGDTHIGSPGGGVLKNVVAAAASFSAQFVIVAGDLTDTGERGQYSQFKALFAERNMPYRVAIGNHDIFFNGWEAYKDEIGRSIYSFDADQVHFVFLDSANGLLGEKQLQWLENDLRPYANQLVVVVSHFPPWNGFFSSVFKMASDEEAAYLKDILYRYDVDYMVAGHFHGFAENFIGKTKYLVTGAANDINDPGQRQHYLRFTVNGSSITYQKVNLN